MITHKQSFSTQIVVCDLLKALISSQLCALSRSQTTQIIQIFCYIPLCLMLFTSPFNINDSLKYFVVIVDEALCLAMAKLAILPGKLGLIAVTCV